MAKAIALGLRLFAFSKYFNVRLDNTKTNSNRYLTIFGTENSNFLVVWEFLGIFSKDELKEQYPKLAEAIRPKPSFHS
jgi:hypothetical protein